jgi:hypothetical protein
MIINEKTSFSYILQINDRVNQIKTFELNLNAKHNLVLVQHLIVQFRTFSCSGIIYNINIF